MFNLPRLNFKGCNLKRHHEHTHKKIQELSMGQRRIKLRVLETNLSALQNIFHKQSSLAKDIISASFRIDDIAYEIREY